MFYFSCTSIGWQSFVAWFICWRPVNQKKANAERKFEHDCKGLCRPADDSVKFSSPALVDQCCEETLKSNKSKKKARQGGQGRCKLVAPPPCSGSFLIVIHCSERVCTEKRDGLCQSLARCNNQLYCPPVAVCWKTPSKVEVSPRVGERGSEAMDEDVEEPAQLPLLPPILHLPPQVSR